MKTSRYIGLIATVLLTVGISHTTQAASTAPKASIAVSAFIVEQCTVSNEMPHHGASVACAHHSAYTVLQQSAPSNVEMLPQQQGTGGIVTVIY